MALKQLRLATWLRHLLHVLLRIEGWLASSQPLGMKAILRFRPSIYRTQYSAIFDEKFYLGINVDVAAAVRAGQFRSGLEHFVLFGYKELGEPNTIRALQFRLRGHMLEYDELAYLADNPDVSALVARRKYASGFDHFVRVGHEECRKGERAPYSDQRCVRLVGRTRGSVLAGSKNNACLFAHYDPDGIIDPYVIEYLRALGEAGLECYLITNVRDASELAKVSDLIVLALLKNEAGRDFGSWYLALTTLGPAAFDNYEYLFLVNDSVYFPVADPRPLFSEMSARKFNFWGISDSREFGVYHVQSFFMAFDKPARDLLLRKFMKHYDYAPYLKKGSQIREFELGFARDAMEAGLSVGAFCSIDDIRELILRDSILAPGRHQVRGLETINPTQDLWDLLVVCFGCPALKIELFRNNPKRAKVWHWKAVVDEKYLPVSMIQNHRVRTKPRPIIRSMKLEQKLRANDLRVELKQQIRGETSEEAARLVLLAHYDPHGIVDDYVVTSVKALHTAGCAVIVITTSNETGELQKLLPHCNSVLVKNDVGRDFGSWYLATKLQLDRFRRYQTVIWMNDSTYFPLFDLRRMFNVMDGRKLDLWGIVDSYNVRWHIMSWFWAFGSRVISSDWFESFIGEFNPAYSKWDQIRNYEMRYPNDFKNKGLAVDSYVRGCEVFDYVIKNCPTHDGYTGRMDFTMTHDYWDIIIKQFKCPALKVELLRDNPLGMDLSTVYETIRDYTEYDPEMIRRHIRRLHTAGRFPDRDYCASEMS